MTSVRIRPASAPDLLALGRLGALLIEQHHAFDAHRFLPGRPSTPNDYAEFLAAQLTNPDVAVLVATVGEEVVGYAYAAAEGFDYMSLRGPAGVLHDLIVAPAFRRRGIGRLLLEAAVAFLKSRGVPQVALTTAEKNLGAQALFANSGFRRTMIEMTREV
jgi:ribosomal protein S18 acetylase RimI-like enzyme